MAWAGLHDTTSGSAWMNLPVEDQLRIGKRNEVELNNLPGFSGNIPVGPNTYYISVTRIGTKKCP